MNLPRAPGSLVVLAAEDAVGDLARQTVVASPVVQGPGRTTVVAVANEKVNSLVATNVKALVLVLAALKYGTIPPVAGCGHVFQGQLAIFAPYFAAAVASCGSGGKGEGEDA